jgi:hypothetical protein
VRQVLGEDFDQDQGAELNIKAIGLEKKLDGFITDNCSEWLKRITDVNVQSEKEKPVFDIIQRLDKYEMVVNFNMQLFNILKEKPNLERHGFKPSITVAYKLNDLKLLQPYARSV